jgi:hypothetical protein
VADDSYDADDGAGGGDGAGESAESKRKEELLEEARSRFKIALEAERENRLLGAEDARFRAGDQWPADVKAAREADNRPCLTINKMPQFEQQVTNDQRQNRPAIKVHPVDDQADIETAKVLQGVIKHIEVSSAADTARDTAFENAVRRSYGFYRVNVDYVTPDSFDQEIQIKRIRDADSVLLDPNSQEPDGSDAEYGFVFERMAKDRFIAEHGESKLATASDWQIEVTSQPDWIQSDTVQVAEYFYKEYRSVDLCLLSDGQVLEKGEAEAYIASHVQATDEMGAPIGEMPEAPTIIKERKARIPTVKWCKLNGCEILDETDWLGQWIPILPVYGAELVVDGKLIRESLIRHAKDPARMYNFWKSAETEAITLAPRTPYVAAAGQIEGFEDIWKTANRKNHAVLPYNPKSLDGTVLPAPQRTSFEPAVQAITQASMLAADEVKQTLGIYDASLGARSNETSGIAIQRRNQQAQTSNFHFTDNLNRTIRHEGRILVDLIPKIYDTARIARIIGDDGEQKVVAVNDPSKPGPHGKPYMLGAGRYDVTVDTGPSYATRRQESASAMIEITKALPNTMGATADLIVKQMDFPGAQEFADRIKKTLPPGLIEDQNDKPIPPQVQAQMAQMGQMLEQMKRDNADLLREREQKLVEIESRERIEFAKIERDYELKRAELDAKDAIALLNHQIAEIEGRMSLLNVGAPIQGQPPEQPSMPEPAGAPGADGGEGMADPTGGALPPGQPMEQSSDDPASF